MCWVFLVVCIMLKVVGFGFWDTFKTNVDPLDTGWFLWKRIATILQKKRFFVIIFISSHETMIFFESVTRLRSIFRRSLAG